MVSKNKCSWVEKENRMSVGGVGGFERGRYILTTNATRHFPDGEIF